MPRTTFSTSALDAATPGLSRLAAALGGAGQAESASYNNTLEAQGRLAQAIAAAHASDAAAGYHTAETAKTNALVGLLANRPDVYNEQVANASGTDLPTVNAYRTQLRTGQAPLVPMGPPTADGQNGVGSLVLPDATRSKIVSAIQQFAPLLTNGGDLNPEQLAKSAQMFRESGLSDDIIAGRADRNVVGGAQAAVAGKPIYNTNTDGAVLDQYGGGLDTSSPIAKSTIALRGAQAGEASAKAGLARAQAGDVTAGKFDPNSGTVVDVRTGRATPVVDVTTGKPIGGKASGGLNQEQANALTFATRMQAADKILGDMATQGTTQPGMIHRIAGALPLVGDAAGALTNGTQSPEQQQVEQAQRDFINAVLRRESGAAISMGEFANAGQQYFPQPGDSAAVKAQKAAARKRVTDLMFSAVPANMRNLPAAAPEAPARTVAVDY